MKMWGSTSVSGKTPWLDGVRVLHFGRLCVIALTCPCLIVWTLSTTWPWWSSHQECSLHLVFGSDHVTCSSQRDKNKHGTSRNLENAWTLGLPSFTARNSFATISHIPGEARWRKSEEPFPSTSGLLDHPALANPPADRSVHGLRPSMISCMVMMLKGNLGSIVRETETPFREIII